MYRSIGLFLSARRLYNCLFPAMALHSHGKVARERLLFAKFAFQQGQIRKMHLIPLTTIVARVILSLVTIVARRKGMRKASLGEQELELLRYVTEHAPVTVAEVMEGYGKQTGLARSTIKTMMERLHKKGY